LGEEARLDSDSLALKSYLYRRIGRFDDAYLTMLAAQKLAPRSVSIVIALVQMAITSDNCDAAKRHLADALSLTADSIRVLTEAAHYELECTGDATRASEWLADADLRSVSAYVLWTARNAAAMQRDFQRAYELTLIPEPGASPALPILDQLLQYDLLIHMGELDRAADKLTAAGEQLAALDRDGTQNQDGRFAQAMAGHSARRGDVEATLRWDEETNRRFRVERKGDRYWLADGRMFRADNLATVGLHKEAIRQLRTMLEEPGGFGFRFVDAWPAFDVLKDHPEYLALRERFADAR
jgi:tetratricopeptide (TPR) repeat protein